MKIKSFHHLCVQTEDYEASMNFYVNLMGFKVIKEEAGFHTRDYNTWLEMSGIMIELQTPKEGTSFKVWSQYNSGPVHFAFVVEDVAEAYQFLKDNGHDQFKVKNGKEIYEVKGANLFKVLAPEGTEIEIRDNPNIY